MFRVCRHLYLLGKIISLGLILKGKMPLCGHLGEVGLLIQPCPKTLP